MRRVLGIGLFSALAWNRAPEVEEEVEPVDTPDPGPEYNCSECGEKKGYFKLDYCKKCKKPTDGSHFGFTK
jgi:hypothetical protein